MSAAGRALNVGDMAMTDYKRGITIVKIVSKDTGTHSQSGVCYQVHPPLNKYSQMTWYDADWFDPVPANLL